MWSKHLRGKIVVFCDNEASVTVLNTDFSKDMFMQSCLREVCYLVTVHGFEVRSRHIVNVENRTVDYFCKLIIIYELYYLRIKTSLLLLLYLSRWHSHNKNTDYFKSCIEGGNYRDVEVLEEFFMFSHDW